MLDKSKIATLVRSQSGMPKMPSTILAVKKPGAGAPGAKPNLPGVAKPAAKPAAKPNIDDMTPQEIAAMVEEAAEAAEKGADPAVEDVLVDYMHGDTSKPPEWVTDRALWQKAVDAVGIGGQAEERYEEPFAVVVYLYKAMGGVLPSQEEAPEQGASETDVTPAKPVGPKPALAAKAAMKGIGNPKLAQPPVHGEAGEGAEPGGKLKQIIDAAAQQAKTNPDPQLAEKLAGYDPARDGNPPQWAVDPDKWAKAEEAVKPHWDEYDEPYAVVAHVYKNMGGGVR